MYLQWRQQGLQGQELQQELRQPRIQPEGQELLQRQEEVSAQETQARRLDLLEDLLLVSNGECRYTPVHLPENFRAGLIGECWEEWRKLTSDRWILRMVKGFPIEFDQTPFQERLPRPIKLRSAEAWGLELALQDFLEQGVIEHCTEIHENDFFSSLFTTPKKDGSARVIFNLSKLNESVEAVHFKMDTIKDAILLMHSMCFFGSIDFKHAYFSVPVLKAHRRFLRFMWHGEVFEFTCLPQGLRSAPRAFTKLMKPPFAKLREKGYVLLGYIDDTIFIGDDAQEIMSGIDEAMRLFDRLGLTISLKKSVLRPVQRIEYLGFILDSVAMTVELTDGKKAKIKKLAQALLKRSHVNIRSLAEFIGNLVATEPGFEEAPLWYRGLELDRNVALTEHFGNFDAMTKLSQKAKITIQWWHDHVETLTRQVSIPPPDIVLESDASTKGWGGCTTTESTGGDWSEEEARDHINVLELKAAFLVLQTFCANLRHKHVRLKLDNTTAIACINKFGSSKERLLQLTTEIFAWARERHLRLSAIHIPGVLNVRADRESRTHNHDIEWQLDCHIFQILCQVFGTPDVDVFASRINHQLPQYVSWKRDPGAIHVDALTFDWHDIYVYAFPPFSLIGHVLRKLEEEKGEALLIVPLWPTRPWFGRILKRLLLPPVILPRGVLQLPQKRDQKHRLEGQLELIACKLSGRPSSWKECRRKLGASLSVHGDQALNDSTTHISPSGYNMHVGGNVVCFHRLW